MSVVKRRLTGVSVETRWRVLYAALGVVGALVVLWLTRFGPGMSGDSTSYLMGAENLLAGRGFSRYSGGYEIRPISGFPPFYSAVLAGFRFLGFGLETAGRVLNALLLALTTFLAAHSVQRYSRNHWAGLLAAALLLTADSILLWHAWLMSEALYLGLMMVGLVTLLRSLEGEGGRWTLAFAGVCFAAASLTRYIGFALIAVGVLSVLWLKRSSWRARLIDAGVLLGSALLPVGLWLGRNAALAGTMTNRELGLRPIDPDLVRLYLAELSSWFIPHQVPLPTAVRAGLALLIAAAIAAVFLWSKFRGGRLTKSWPWVDLGGRPYAALPWVTATLAAAHLGVLAVNSLLLDASTTPPAVPRYLTPVFVLVVCFGTAAIPAAGEKLWGAWAGWAGAGYAVVLLVFYMVASAPLFQEPVSHLGYTAYRMRWGSVVETLREIEPEQPIVSNNPELVYALTGRPAYVRPIRFDHYQQEVRGDFKVQLENTLALLEAGGVYVVFHPVETPDETTLEFTGAEPLVSYPQATFYGLPGEGSLNGD